VPTHPALGARYEGDFDYPSKLDRSSPMIETLPRNGQECAA